MAQTIDGRRGGTREEATQEMKNSGSIQIPSPTYGYLRDSQLSHEWIDICLYNDWAQRDLDELIYGDGLGRDGRDKEFMCQVGGFDCRYRTKYTR